MPIGRRPALFTPVPRIKSPVDVMGESALKAAEAVVWPVPPLAIATVPVTFPAIVAVVADVAVDALPVKAPTKVVDVTEVRPAMVVAVPPRLTAVEPIVMLELVSAPLGMFVRLAPEPLNTVADNVPVDGTYWYLVELVYSVDKVPLVTEANKG